MSRRNRKIAAADVPADAGAPDQIRSHNELPIGSPDSSTPDPVLTPQQRETIAAVSASGKAPPRPGSKLGIVLDLLEAPEGASLARLVEVTGWQPHTSRRWMAGLIDGSLASTEAIAEAEGMGERNVRKLLVLACLAPSIIRAIADGAAPANLTISRLTAALPHDWVSQEQRLLAG